MIPFDVIQMLEISSIYLYYYASNGQEHIYLWSCKTVQFDGEKQLSSDPYQPRVKVSSQLKFQQDQLVAFKSNRRPDKNLLKILNSVKKCTSYFFCFVFRFKGSLFLGVFSFSFCLFQFGFLYFLPRVSKLIYTHIFLAHSMMPAYPQQ